MGRREAERHIIKNPTHTLRLPFDYSHSPPASDFKKPWMENGTRNFNYFTIAQILINNIFFPFALPPASCFVCPSVVQIGSLILPLGPILRSHRNLPHLKSQMICKFLNPSSLEAKRRRTFFKGPGHCFHSESFSSAPA